MRQQVGLCVDLIGHGVHRVDLRGHPSCRGCPASYHLLPQGGVAACATNAPATAANKIPVMIVVFMVSDILEFLDNVEK
ncbi:hypothetical protein [Acidiphilium sp. 20-67-58]|uniref:hypothetical protein n=1 Tax=Acidiphilium sp. 20-67-58 TaxID=1970291 RepID=UPI0025B8726B|nr:hypothetical protein [Acidiphilium sp. 20-67-58]